MRTYDIAAKIIHFHQIESICLLLANVQKRADLERGGVTISCCRDLGEAVTILDRRASNIIAFADIHKQDPFGHRAEATRMVVGDFNVDYLVSQASFGSGGIVERPQPSVGGTAVNAGRAFQLPGSTPFSSEDRPG